MIIGLVGRSRSGKDTVASLIQELYPDHHFRIVRLSAPVKDAARALFRFTDRQIEGAEKECVDPRWNVTPRHVFQAITEATMQRMGFDFFTRLLYDAYDSGAYGANANIILPDIRYEHDIAEIQRRHGRVFLVRRSDLPVRHACEDHLDALSPTDGRLTVLSNDGTLDDLRALIKTNLILPSPGAHA